MAKFNFKASKKQAQTEHEKTKGGSFNRLKLGPKLNRILILPPVGDNPLFKRTMIHQVWKNRKPVHMAACPRSQDGEECKVCQKGFSLKEKFEDSKNSRKQNVWRNFMPTNDNNVNAYNLDTKEQGVLKMPKLADELLLNEIDESETGEDICDLNKGRAMRIKGNGKSGNDRRYVLAKFESNPVGLLSKGKVDEEEILGDLYNLEKLQPPVNESKLEKVYRALMAQVNGVDGGDEDEEEEEGEEEETKSKKRPKDDEEEVDGDDDDEDDFESDEDDEDEKSSKKKSKKSDKDDEDEDEEESDGDDSDDEESDEDDDEPPVKKKKSSKSSDEDEDEEEEDDSDDEDSDEDDGSEEEEEESDDDDDMADDDGPTVKKKKSRR